jgi:hypothetical protein
VTYIQGLLDSYQEEQNLQTPQEVGEEQTHRILSIEPSEGMIESYSQIPLTFFCKSWVEEDHQIWTKNYNLAKEEINSIQQLYKYTAVFFFSSKWITTPDEQDANRILQMEAKAVCPKITFHTQHLDFGDCCIGDSRSLELRVENRNDEGSGLIIESPVLSQFITNPKKLVLLPAESKVLSVMFKPKNLGNFNLDSKFLVNKDYEICLKFTGKALALERLEKCADPTTLPYTKKMSMTGIPPKMSNSHDIAIRNSKKGA